MARQKSIRRKISYLGTYHEAWPETSVALEQVDAAIESYRKQQYKYIHVGITTDLKMQYDRHQRLDSISWMRMAVKFKTENYMVAKDFCEKVSDREEWINNGITWPESIFDEAEVYYVYVIIGKRMKNKKNIKKYNVIDLFSGCGGISKGFLDTKRTNIIGAIDFDKDACNTFELNFPTSKVICGDINLISVDSTGFKDIDIIIGGPPCQGFSRLNFRDKDRDNDPRNKLFYQYLRFVEELKPKAILIENVKNALVAKDGFVPQAITSILGELGYNVSYSIVCAADFGVPQSRERAIFIALKKEYGTFDFSTLESFKSSQVTVYDAISDIADIEDDVKSKEVGSVFKLGIAKTKYQKMMRLADGALHNHLLFYPNESVQKKISYVPQGGNWRYVPKELFPSERTNRYTNYLRRLNYSSPSITIDTGHRVYFHPIFNRVPTVRESARLQSFPDSFIFTGAKSKQLKQVGNAVPPLMAKALAKAIISTLENQE